MSSLHTAIPTPSFCSFWHGHPYIPIHFLKMFYILVHIYIQLIYDFKDKGSSIGLITLLPDDIPPEDKEQFSKMGVEIPSMKLVD